MPITDREKSEVDAANLSGKQPVAFIHGLWLLPNSWDAWRSHFEDLGYSTLAPGWPDDPDTIEQALANPDAFAGKSINDICTHLAEVLKGLNTNADHHRPLVRRPPHLEARRSRLRHRLGRDTLPPRIAACCRFRSRLSSLRSPC